MFQLEFDVVNKILLVKLTGFWTVDTVRDFGKAMEQIFRRYAPKFPGFPMLSDARDFTILSREAGEEFEKAFQNAPQPHNGRVAIIVTSSLMKMQADRVVRQSNRRCFTDEALARHWALHGDGVCDPEPDLSSV